MQSMTWSFLMLLVVMAMIPASIWVLKRVQTVRTGGLPQQLEVLARLPIGTREQVVLLRVQGRVLVIGATAQQINLLAEADATGLEAHLASTGGSAGGFASLMQAATRRTPGAGKTP